MLLSKRKLFAAAMLAVAVVAGRGVSYGLAGEPPAKDDKAAAGAKEDKDAILGTWKVEVVESDGKDASETDEGREHKGATLTITAGKIAFKTARHDGEFSYRLDPAAKPKTLDMDNGEGKTIDCVYALDRDTLKICGPRKNGGPRPAMVATEEGSESFLLVLKREADDKK